MSQLTQVLKAVEDGELEATEKLLPMVYHELRKIAAFRLASEPGGHTLQPTALVHEAYLRLLGSGTGPQWKSHRHFFAAAAESMRRILIDHARHKKSLKAGGAYKRQEWHDSEIAAPDEDERLLALDRALDQLAATDHEAAELVKLRYFSGLTIPQAAEVLGVSPRTADRIWAYSKAWLFRAINQQD